MKRLEEGKREEEEEEETERKISIRDRIIGGEQKQSCMLFMETSDSTLSWSYNNTDIYHNKAL